MTSMLLLHLPDNLSRHRGMEIDCVVPQALSCLVTLTTTTFERFADTNLCSVTILSMVLYAIHILVSLFTSRNWAGKRLLFPSVHAHGAEDGFGADGALRGPGLVAVRLLVVHLLLIVFAACRGTESKGCQGQSPPAGVLWPPRGQEEPVAGWAAAPARERAFRAQRACKHVWSLGQAWWEDTCSPT